MIRLALPSGSPSGPSFRSPGPVIRVGRSAGCDLRFDGDRHPQVSFHHAELVLEDGRWLVADADSDGGVYLNGRRVTREALRPGDRIAFGEGGPEVRVEVADAAAEEEEDRGLDALRQQTYRDLADGARQKDAPEEEEREGAEAAEKGQEGRTRTSEQSAAKIAEEVARKVAEQRALAGGQSSGQTMFIMADALEQADALARKKSRRKWLRVVSAVGAAAVLVTGGMGVVIVRQKRQLDALIQEKQRIDEEILSIHEQMRVETDEATLAALEDRLEVLTGKAVSKLDEVGKSDRQAAAALAEGDELDRDIRAVLKKFNAETYSVPPVFKERLRFHIDKLLYRRNMDLARARKARYWPMISRAFAARQLPEELGYIAYVESTFDPEAFHPRVEATGMWQFIAKTARENGLQVDGKVDERKDAAKSTEAAAQYLTKLMSDWGQESFLLVIASYNMGEHRLRAVLRKVALMEAGGFRKRDFWHLYRLKLLPEETREYVPSVIASAIVLGNPERYAGRAREGGGPE